MADAPPYPDNNGDAGYDTGTPRWVKMLGIVVAVVALLIVAIMFIGGGEHGPGRHMPDGPAGPTPPSSVTKRGVQQP